jgi:hypothetical protein
LRLFLGNNIKYSFGVLVHTLIIILLCNINTSAQPVKKDTVYHTPFDTNKISNPYILDYKSDTIGIQSFIWSDRKNLSEILNDKAGYFINYLGVGGRNPINYNNFDDKQIGIFRDGVQINDNFFGGFDEENISISEIEKIEVASNISSFLYGVNTSGKSINVITKDAFQPTLFSQLRYSQDRYGAMFADFSLNVPFSKKFNFIFGINSHFYDGYYDNSDFNVWRGRMKLNFYSSPKLNIKASFYHTKINRRLNGGLEYSTNDTLKNQNFASVYSLGSYEKLSNYYFDITFNANLFNDKNSLTKLIFYTNNSLRLFRNGENGVDTGVYIKEYFHSIQYGIDLKQNYRIKFANGIESNLLAGGNAYFNLYNFTIPYKRLYVDGTERMFIQNNYYNIISKIDLLIKQLLLSGSYKFDVIDNSFYNLFGLEGKYKVFNKDDYNILLKGGFNSTTYGFTYLNYSSDNETPFYSTYNSNRRKYCEFGVEAKYKNIYLDAYQYSCSLDNSFSFANGNYTAKLLTKYFDFVINASYSSETYYPPISLKSDIVYHNFFFNDKLDLKFGISLKYFSKTYLYTIDQQNYTKSIYLSSDGSPFEKDFFNMDFYVGARIGTANINITVANIFNNVNYTTGIYPYDARGGFLNSIARFSIVWDYNR